MPNGAGFTRRRGENGGRTPVPPDSQARTGPSWSDPGGNAVGVPPLPSDCHEHPSAGGDAAGPPGPARAAQSVGHVTAQSGPGGPGCRLAERPQSESGWAELASVDLGPGPVRARAARSGAGREPGARLPAAAPSAGGATRIRAGPRGRPEKARPYSYRRDKTSHSTEAHCQPGDPARPSQRARIPTPATLGGGKPPQQAGPPVRPG
jgi:hypothetical protein